MLVGVAVVSLLQTERQYEEKPEHLAGAFYKKMNQVLSAG